MKSFIKLGKIILPLGAAYWLFWNHLIKIEVQDESEDITPDAEIKKIISPPSPPKKLINTTKGPLTSKVLSPLVPSNPDNYFQYNEENNEKIESLTQVPQAFYELNNKYFEQFIEEDLDLDPNPSPQKKKEYSNPTIGPLTYDSTPISPPTPKTTTNTPEQSSYESSGQTLISVESDKSPGTYSFPIDVGLTLKINGVTSNSGFVFYCKGSAGACCDDAAITSTYTVAVELGNEGNGNYCLSFYGKTSGGIATQPTDLIIKIDDTLPSLPEIAENYYEVQSTERYIFSLPPITYSALPPANTALSLHWGTDSGLLAPDCQDVAENILPLDFQLDGSPDYFDFIKYLNDPFPFYIFHNFANLQYGDNYVVNLLSKKTLDRVSYNCSSLQILVKDFEAYSSLPLANATTEGGYLIGGFISQGFFDTTASTTQSSGHGRNNELHSDFMNTVF